MPKYTINLSTRVQSWIVCAICLAAAAGAAWFMAKANRAIALAEAVPTMVETTARVLTARPNSIGRPRMGADYTITVEYSYDVSGTSYRSSTAWLQPPKFSSRSAASAGAESLGLTPGTDVQVFYKPDEPSLALLFRDTDAATIERQKTEWLICVVLLAVCVAGAVGAGSKAIRAK